MKQIVKKLKLIFCFGILFCALILNVEAQDSKTLSKIYLQGSAGFSTYESGDYDLAIKTVFKNKWSMTLSYKALEMTPKNEPSDYQPEIGYILFIPYTYQATADMSIISLTAGKYFALGKNTWATTEGGLSYVKGEKVNYQRAESVTTNIIIAASTSSNYSTTKESKSGIGAMLQADINWAFASFMGLGAGVYANINSVQSPIGVDLKLFIGKTGRKKKS